MINLLDNTPNQPTKYGTKDWVEINDDSRGTYNTDSQIQFKTSILSSILCDYSHSYIPVSGTITITGGPNDATDANKRSDERNKGVIFKNCAPSTDCISEINNTQIDNGKYIDFLKPMYNLIEYSNNYSKTPRSLWHFYRNEPNDNIEKFESFQFKVKISGKTLDAEIPASLKHSSNSWRTLEMPLINAIFQN